MSSDSTFFYRQAPPDRGASSFIYPPTPANLDFFAQAMQAGCLLAIPTETVYGLAGTALEEAVCRSIFSVKGRPLVDPLIVHVSSIEMAEQVAELTAEAHALAAQLWPGPLTLVLKKRSVIPDIVTAGKPTVAVRMPAHPATGALLNRLGKPVAAPSANPFGYVSPTRPEHVRDSFGDRVPFILDGGPCKIGIESAIVDLSQPGRPRILRPGAVASEQLEAILGVPVENKPPTVATDASADAPGTFSKHYSPTTPISLFESGTSPDSGERTAILYLKRPVGSAASRNVFWLSEDGDPLEISRSLFHLLRQLDSGSFDAILCEFPPEGDSGIQQAIRDRMRRAASPAE